MSLSRLGPGHRLTEAVDASEGGGPMRRVVTSRFEKAA